MVDWRRTCFLLIAPDALARNLGTAVIDRVMGMGFAPIGYRLCWATPEQIDAMNAINVRQRWEVYRYRLVDMLFAFGPCLAVLLDDAQPRTEAGSHARLSALKGSSHLHDLRVGTIRGDLGIINGLLAVIHTSDNEDSAARESAIFFGQRNPQADRDDRIDVKRFCQILEASHPEEARDFDAVLAGFRWRLVRGLWDDLSPRGRQLATRLVASPMGICSPGVGLDLAEALRPEVPTILREVVACDFQPGGTTIDFITAGRILAAFQVEVDPWERLVLSTSLIFEPVRRMLQVPA